MNSSHSEPAWVRRTLIGSALAAMAVVLVVPLVAVFWEGLAAGWQVYWAAVTDPDARHAIWLTLLAAAISLVINGVAGIAAAWAIAKFRFPGRSLLITAIELPFSVSPVVVGLLFVLLFGSHGWFGAWLQSHDVRVIFAMPGIVLATLFITFPFVVRELLPVMEAVGSEEEEAARVLGARGWQILWRITLPNVKWGLMYGLILCSARAIGEFGAVSVVSGHIRGETNTMPLHVEILYNDYQYNAAFACASVLCLTALVTLVLKAVVEWRAERALNQAKVKGGVEA
ncbi:MAG TPA: sulfate ABC transporter permease subunit CysW [Planctomycetes bacterium]|nr:sulfate ABC transporter permease subunit CysW [Planctomycetota bacterium]